MKGQSNTEIARTPRNVFRCSLGRSAAEVERPTGCEGFTACQVLTNSECRRVLPGSKGAGAKVRVRERNNSDHRLRSRNPGRVGANNEVGPQRQPGCWLGSSHSFKECVTAHWSSGPAWIIIGHKPGTEAVVRRLKSSQVGEHSGQLRSRPARGGGASGKANVGMSNDNGGGKPPRRKAKDS